eukprot:3549339-Pleurochrysis_carterae.AAC.3
MRLEMRVEMVSARCSWLRAEIHATAAQVRPTRSGPPPPPACAAASPRPVACATRARCCSSARTWSSCRGRARRSRRGSWSLTLAAPHAVARPQPAGTAPDHRGRRRRRWRRRTETREPARAGAHRDGIARSLKTAGSRQRTWSLAATRANGAQQSTRPC